MMNAKATQHRSDPIIINNVRDIITYFDDRYNDLNALQKRCGALFLEIELYRGNERAETYMAGLAMGHLDSMHPRGAWALEALSQWQSRGKRSRTAFVNGSQRRLRQMACELHIELE